MLSGRSHPGGHGATREQGDAASRPAFWLMAAFLAAVALLGGASRGDEAVLLLLRPLAVLAMLAWLLACSASDWGRVRVPLRLLGALAAVMIVQLIPLPPTLWSALPGHARLLQTAEVAGMAQPWRPISIAPQLTWNALFALLVPAAALVGMAHVAPRDDRRLVLAMAGIALLSAIVGLLQVGGSSALSPYRITSPELAVGLFTNRNHQAVFLGAALPLLAALAVSDRRWQAHALAGGAGLVAIATILATASRSGLLAAGAGLALSAWIVGRDRWRSGERLSPRAIGIGVAAALLVAGLLAALAIARGVAFERWSHTEIGSEQRLRWLPVVIRLAIDYCPFGTGFGTFDPAFRIAEPDWALHQSFFNHAHNDLAELLMTGGLAAGLVLLGFAVWLVRAGLATHRRLRGTSRDGSQSRRAVHAALAGFMALLFAASLADYPLRTPLLMTLVAIAAVLLSTGPSDRPSDRPDAA